MPGSRRQIQRLQKICSHPVCLELVLNFLSLNFLQIHAAEPWVITMPAELERLTPQLRLQAQVGKVSGVCREPPHHMLSATRPSPPTSTLASAWVVGLRWDE